MPKQSEAQILGDAAELWFQTQLPPGWVPQRPTRDVGVDFLVVICEQGSLNGQEFRVQVKSSKRFQVSDSSIVIPGIKWSTIDYWFTSPIPTMIVAYDHEKKTGYYRWHNELFEKLHRLRSDKSTDTVSLRIPTPNELLPDRWDNIREGLLQHHANLRISLREARNARSVLPVIHDLTGAVRRLSFIEHRPIPEDDQTSEQEGLLILVEMLQHREVISAASGLLDELMPDSEGAERLASWIEEYRDMVESVFPAFAELEGLAEDDHIPPDLKVVYAPTLVQTVRPKLVQRALELIMLLTPQDGEN